MRRLLSAGLLGLVVVFGFTVAGCGGGGKKSSSATPAATTTAAATTQAASPPPPTPPPPTPPPPPPPPPTTPPPPPPPPAATTAASATPPPPATTPNLSAFTGGRCKDLVSAGQKLAAAFTGKTQDLGAEAAAFKKFADQAPSDIRSDFQTLADAFSKIANALKGVNLKSGQTPSAADLQKLQSLSKVIDQTKVQAASQHIQAWAAKNCHA